MCVFELEFSPDTCLSVELQDHMITLSVVVQETSILFSIVAVPSYIRTNSVGAFLFLHTLFSIYYL